MDTSKVVQVTYDRKGVRHNTHARPIHHNGGTTIADILRARGINIGPNYSPF